MKSEENIFSPSTEKLSTAVLVLDDSNTLTLAAAIDPMRAANRRAGQALFDWSFYSATGGAAHLTSHIDIAAQPIAKLDRTDLLIVVAGFKLDTHATPALMASLRRLAPRCRAIAGIDGGSWILARAGLLDGHCATTHWEDLEAFANRFDKIEVLRDRYVISGKFITSGGAAPAMDLMLHLIAARHGADLAARVASAFIYDPVHDSASPQGMTATARIARKHPVVARAVRLMETHIEDPLRISEISKALGVSARLLEQQFQQAISQTPKSFYLSLRLSEARRLAQDSGHTVQNIALSVGFPSQASFARAFRAAHGTSVRELRQRPRQ